MNDVLAKLISALGWEQTSHTIDEERTWCNHNESRVLKESDLIKELKKQIYEIVEIFKDTP